MSSSAVPFPLYPYILEIGETGEQEVMLGWFSEVSGLTGLHTVGDITLKRGIVNAPTLWDWITEARGKGTRATRNGLITSMDEANKPVQSWKPQNVVPAKYTGPSLEGKESDIAIEELVLAVERIEAVVDSKDWN
jgi:phage tail-like protein